MKIFCCYIFMWFSKKNLFRHYKNFKINFKPSWQKRLGTRIIDDQLIFFKHLMFVEVSRIDLGHVNIYSLMFIDEYRNDVWNRWQSLAEYKLLNNFDKIIVIIRKNLSLEAACQINLSLKDNALLAKPCTHDNLLYDNFV